MKLKLPSLRVSYYPRYRVKEIKLSRVIAITLIAICVYVTSLNGTNIEYSMDVVIPTSLNALNEMKHCKLLPSNEGPRPVILMALGRSGSSVTWDTMARMIGDANVAYEITGGNQTKSQRFFDSIDPNLGSSWPIQRLCYIQKRVMSQTAHSGIAGFQWKPYQNTINHKYSIGALKEISKHQDPAIQIIYLTRNTIDRYISNQRHEGYIRTKEVPHHCKAGDEECIQKHKKRSKDVILPTGSELINHIKQTLAHDEYVKEKLANAGVKHLHVSYEELFHAESAAEWMKLFRFLNRGPMVNLTIDMVREKFSMASTSPRKHEEKITNYEEVERSLRGTRYYHMLH